MLTLQEKKFIVRIHHSVLTIKIRHISLVFQVTYFCPLKMNFIIIVCIGFLSTFLLLLYVSNMFLFLCSTFTCKDILIMLWGFMTYCESTIHCVFSIIWTSNALSLVLIACHCTWIVCLTFCMGKTNLIELHRTSKICPVNFRGINNLFLQ